MTCDHHRAGAAGDIFRSAELYDRSIDWEARIAREVPVLLELFGPPGDGGIVDAGCGTGRQATALAGQGYRVIAADISEEMLTLGRRRVGGLFERIDFVGTSFASLHEKIGGGFDGLYCVGNSLAASGSREAARQALEQFGQCLRPGGRLFMQVLNFAPLRQQTPCVRGPRVATVDGVEHISTRHFQFIGDTVRVTNVTLWHDKKWHQEAHSGTLYPISLPEIRSWCAATRIDLEHVWGSYQREAFDLKRSSDLIIVGEKREKRGQATFSL